MVNILQQELLTKWSSAVSGLSDAVQQSVICFVCVDERKELERCESARRCGGSEKAPAALTVTQVDRPGLNCHSDRANNSLTS